MGADVKHNWIKGSVALCLVLCLLAVAPMAAQTAEPPAAQSDSQATDDKQKAEDDVEPGKGKISEFGEALAQFWSVSSAFQATQSFDDNIFLNNTFRKRDTATKLSGRITAAYRGQHTRFEASYLPEYNLYQRYTPMNYASHNYVQTLRHDFSRRLEMHWNAGASYSPSRGGLPFKAINFGGYRFNYYAPEALSEGLNLLHFSNKVGVSYRLSPRWKVYADVDGVSTHFSERGNPTVSPVMKDAIYSLGGTVGADYSLNANQSIGFNVKENYFGSVGPSEHQHQQTLNVTYNHKLSRGYRISLSAGPGITERAGVDPLVSAFFTASLQRQMTRSSFAITFDRSTRVGLLQDSITGYGGTVRANRRIGRKWTTGAGATYHRSEGASGVHQLESASANAQIGYQLTRHISPYLNYGYIHQKNLVPSPTTRNVSRNEVAIGFVYNFGVIAGR
jgi:hypothetical protein